MLQSIPSILRAGSWIGNVRGYLEKIHEERRVFINVFYIWDIRSDILGQNNFKNFTTSKLDDDVNMFKTWSRLQKTNYDFKNW